MRENRSSRLKRKRRYTRKEAPLTFPAYAIDFSSVSQDERATAICFRQRLDGKQTLELNALSMGIV